MSNQPEPVILEKSILATYLSNFDDSHNLEEVKSIFKNTSNLIESYKNVADYTNSSSILYPESIKNNNKYILELKKLNVHDEDSDDEDSNINNYYIDNTKINIKEKNKLVIIPNTRKWDPLTQFYVGSLSIVGLYILFKTLQKSK
jgi:hypothetical protein